jgi:AcrR family transcriptional regulator
MEPATSLRKADRPTRKRRSDGERSRAAILDEAARLATVEGIQGISIGRLADAVGMSKSGLFAHFGSKEELQLATVGAARDVFAREVTAPAAEAPSVLERLRGLSGGFSCATSPTTRSPAAASSPPCWPRSTCSPAPCATSS